jgi:hypothetical protein
MTALTVTRDVVLGSPGALAGGFWLSWIIDLVPFSDAVDAEPAVTRESRIRDHSSATPAARSGPAGLVISPPDEVESARRR